MFCFVAFMMESWHIFFFVHAFTGATFVPSSLPLLSSFLFVFDNFFLFSMFGLLCLLLAHSTILFVLIFCCIFVFLQVFLLL